MTLQFDHTIVKVNEDGNVVLSNTLYEGEKLINGDTYADVAERVGDQTIGIPAATETVSVEVPALTLDSTMTSTVPAETPVTVETTAVVQPENTDPEGGSGEQLGAGEATGNEVKGTTDDEKHSTVIEELDDKDKTGVRPDDDAPKAVWFEYAQGKGHKGEYEDITKKQLIEQYGD